VETQTLKFTKRKKFEKKDKSQTKFSLLQSIEWKLKFQKVIDKEYQCKEKMEWLEEFKEFGKFD
jgi:hypothetical protein